MRVSPRLRFARSDWLLVAAIGCTPERPASTHATNGGNPPATDTCSVAHHVEVPLDPFGTLSDPPQLVPFADRFGIVDAESVTPSKTASVAVVSWQGIDTQNDFALTELCPDDVCRNVHGTSVLGTSSGALEFLLAEQGSAVSMPAYPLRALAWDSDQSAAAISPLFDARVTAITTRAALESSRAATRATFALGNIDMATIEAVVLAEQATLVAPPQTLMLPDGAWDCLSVVPTDEAGAISAVTQPASGTEVVWSVWELDAQANVLFTTSVEVPVGTTLGYSGCPRVIESPLGFHAQWLNSAGASVIASVARSDGTGAPPDVLSLDASPGSLEAVLHDDFLFQASLADDQQSFIRVTRDGAASGPTITLPALPVSTLEERRAAPQVLGLRAAAVNISYELETTRVFEELDCP
jgi:hypothetical protein